MIFNKQIKNGNIKMCGSIAELESRWGIVYRIIINLQYAMFFHKN